MTYTEVSDRIYNILVDSYGLDKFSFKPNESFNLAMDSMDRTQLVLDLEEEFGTEIPEEDLPQVGCIDCAAKYIVRKCA